MLTITTKAKISAQQPYILLEGIPEGEYEIVVVLQPSKQPARQPLTFESFQFPMIDSERFSRSAIYGDDGR